jgi:hypothetical protein
MDNGIWATWYDLEDGTRDRFLDWLHTDYLPALKQRPGYAWVAHYRNEVGGPAMRHLGQSILARPDEDVGSGTQFLMLVGAASPHVFLAPSVNEPETSPQFREMLALRCGLRTAIFSEEARVSGPAARYGPPGTTPAPAIQMGSFRVRSLKEEFDLGCWYAQYRLPYMAQAPGSVGTRKLLSVAGWAKHSILYEFTSLEARLKNFEEPHESLSADPKEWTGRVVRYTIHAPGSPFVGTRIWPPVVDQRPS